MQFHDVLMTSNPGQCLITPNLMCPKKSMFQTCCLPTTNVLSIDNAALNPMPFKSSYQPGSLSNPRPLASAQMSKSHRFIVPFSEALTPTAFISDTMEDVPPWNYLDTISVAAVAVFPVLAAPVLYSSACAIPLIPMSGKKFPSH